VSAQEQETHILVRNLQLQFLEYKSSQEHKLANLMEIMTNKTVRDVKQIE
jgi:hypothetical protein